MKKPTKTERQNQILELIATAPISTQTALVERMRGAGLDITQATISRDIKELNIVKVADSAGKQRYVSMGHGPQQPADRLMNVFAEAVVNVRVAVNLVVIHTLPGMAQAGASAVDSLNLQSVVGTLAGDDTIFVAAESEAAAADLADRLNRYRS